MATIQEAIAAARAGKRIKRKGQEWLEPDILIDCTVSLEAIEDIWEIEDIKFTVNNWIAFNSSLDKFYKKYPKVKLGVQALPYATIFEEGFKAALEYCTKKRLEINEHI